MRISLIGFAEYWRIDVKEGVRIMGLLLLDRSMMGQIQCFLRHGLQSDYSLKYGVRYIVTKLGLDASWEKSCRGRR
jgi:hypothetical protein